MATSANITAIEPNAWNSGIVGVGEGVTKSVGVGDAVGLSDDIGAAVGVEVVTTVGAGVGVGDAKVPVTVTCVTLLPPEPSISKPSGPIIINLGSGCMLLGKSVPFTL